VSDVLFDAFIDCFMFASVFTHPTVHSLLPCSFFMKLHGTNFFPNLEMLLCSTSMNMPLYFHDDYTVK
jgi:hypothetical protein